MLRQVDGFGYCDFPKSVYKYNQNAWAGSFPCSDWFSRVSGTLTGSIDPGPFPGTFGITFALADSTPDFVGNTGWHQVVPIGQASSNSWFVSMWIKPQNITSRQTFFALLDGIGVPNEIGVMTLHINANGFIEVDCQTSGQLRMNTLQNPAGVSTTPAPMGEWTHLCVGANLQTLANGGRIKLWINGTLQSNLPVPVGFPGASAPVNQAGLLWQNTGSAEITLSQLVVCDSLGGVNNSQLFPSTQIQTIFPTGDVATGWTPSTGSLGYAMVDENPGPDGDSRYISLPSLAFPDELFSIPSASGGGNLGVAVNLCMKGSGQTLQALTKRSGVSNVLGSPLSAPTAYQTHQGLSDVDPLTGLAWTDANISASAWGVRGLSGTGERVTQFFLEKVWGQSLGSYSY